jgi:hypothetical protein
MNVNDFDCHALCDLGISTSIMPRKIYYIIKTTNIERPRLNKDCTVETNASDLKKNATGYPMKFSATCGRQRVQHAHVIENI